MTLDQLAIALAVVFAVNLLPAFGPPTWAVLVFFSLDFALPAVPLSWAERWPQPPGAWSSPASPASYARASPPRGANALKKPRRRFSPTAAAAPPASASSPSRRSPPASSSSPPA
jgi:hypothetical protein